MLFDAYIIIIQVYITQEFLRERCWFDDDDDDKSINWEFCGFGSMRSRKTCLGCKCYVEAEPYLKEGSGMC